MPATVRIMKADIKIRRTEKGYPHILVETEKGEVEFPIMDEDYDKLERILDDR